MVVLQAPGAAPIGVPIVEDIPEGSSVGGASTIQENGSLSRGRALSVEVWVEHCSGGRGLFPQGPAPCELVNLVCQPRGEGLLGRGVGVAAASRE